MRALPKILTFLLLIAVAGIASAQTPDGQTPAEEQVCTDAGLTGAAWGLCNAYCEAMDCHCFEDGSCVPNASQKACDRVKTNYEKKTTDPLPCEVVVCPCLDRNQWTDTTWVDIVDSAPAETCSTTGNTTTATLFGASAVVVVDGINSSCRSEEASDPPQTIETLNLLSGEQAAACAAILTGLCS